MPETETEITEFEALEATKVSGVGSPANGTPWMLLKAAAPDGTEDEEMTKACGDLECGVCEPVAKGKLKAADRKKLPKGSFAIPEKAPGSGSYPIPDEDHGRDALARASGKDVEDRVRAAVRRKFPDIEQAEKDVDDTPVEKSPGVPAGSTATPQATARVHQFAESGLRGPMTDGTKEPDAVDTPGGETPAVGGSNTQVIPVASAFTAKDALAEAQACLEQEDARAAEKGDGWVAADNTETVEKIGRRLSTRTETALRAARDHLAHVLGEDSTTQAGHAGNTSEEDQIMTTLTKEELDAVVAKAVKEDRQARAARKAAKAAKRAKKNANNGGDIDRATIEAGVHGTHDADDIASAGGDVKPEYRATKALEEQIEVLTKQVNAIAARPRSGGPNLTGTIPAGLLAAAEGRQGEGVAKSAEDETIETLQKQLDTALAGKDSQRATDLSYRLTKAQLVQMHRQGDERTVKLFG